MHILGEKMDWEDYKYGDDYDYVTLRATIIMWTMIWLVMTMRIMEMVMTEMVMMKIPGKRC